MIRSAERGLKPDYVLVILVLTLTVLGILMVYSASVVLSYTATKNSNFFFQRQFISVILGIIAFFITSKIHYSYWRKIAPVALFVGLLLSLLVLFPGLGTYRGGARRWLELGPISFQPSEALKLGLILYFASFFERVEKEIKTLNAFIPFVSVILISSLLLMLQPDMGTFMVICGISTAMFFIAGASLKHMAVIIGSGLLGIVALIKAAPYRMDRFLVFLNPSGDKSGTGYQINQALIAIGSGGLFGLGFNKSRQKYQYLPEAQTDSIIAIMAEELGFIRLLVILAIFVMLVLRGMVIAKNSPDLFSKLTAFGIVSWLAVQSIINIAANLSLVPLTGVPLPFISFGGSSVIILLSAFGILTNISKYSVKGGRL